MTDLRVSFFDWLAARMERRRITDELNSYTDRELDDIGILRADIPRIARTGAAQRPAGTGNGLAQETAPQQPGAFDLLARSIGVAGRIRI